ncbi:hypothetical protein AB0E69_10595 [Kribbella sp. NPDC026611]|uniref:hypothetical protein n=1 Tax=Kribbella sp. NPDC026611 TaxID=3154911 RepID=UPI0033DAD305
MPNKTIARAVATTAGVVGIALVGATSASAAVVWQWTNASGNAIGQATYTDTNNVIHVNDQEADDHSMVFVFRPNGGGATYGCWDNTGAGTGGVNCTMTQFNENQLLEGRLCKGEWSADASSRIILWNQCDNTGWRNFRK